MNHMDAMEILKYSRADPYRVPSVFSLRCGPCGARSIYNATWKVEAPHFAATGVSVCPGCRSPITLLAAYLPVSERELPTPAMVTVYPPPHIGYVLSSPIDGLSPALQRALTSTIDSFNSKNYTATAVGCRRALEGIFQYLLPLEQRRDTLHKMIESVTKTVDLAAPIKGLSHAIRGGGNLGAHFNEDVEPDGAMATKMVDLLDYLVSYLYVLPSRISGLEGDLAPKGESDSPP